MALMPDEASFVFKAVCLLLASLLLCIQYSISAQNAELGSPQFVPRALNLIYSLISPVPPTLSPPPVFD